MNAVWLSPQHLCIHTEAAKQGPDLQTLVPSGLDWLMKAMTGWKPLPQKPQKYRTDNASLQPPLAARGVVID